MCLGVPGKIVEWLEGDGVFAQARVEFDGTTRVCSMACVPDAQVGDYVVVHAGMAISRINEQAAEETIRDLKQL